MHYRVILALIAPQHTVVQHRTLSTLERIALLYSTISHSVTHVNFSWFTITHGNTPQHPAARRNILQRTQLFVAHCTPPQWHHGMLQCTIIHSSTSHQLATPHISHGHSWLVQCDLTLSLCCSLDFPYSIYKDIGSMWGLCTWLWTPPKRKSKGNMTNCRVWRVYL